MSCWNKMIYTFLIGSGFSVPVGLPTSKELNERITKADELPIGFASNGALVQNYDGSKPYFGYTTSYEATFQFGMRLIRDYCLTHDVFDYEEFFDYFNDIHKKAAKKVQEKELQERYPLLPPHYYAREEKEGRRGLELYQPTYQLNHIYQELIDYLLILPKNVDFESYEPFINHIKKLINRGNIVNIYSLNHDVLIEKIIEHFHLEAYFCDGFTDAGTAYYGDVSGTKHQLEYFANQYDKPIRLHKLHGSTSYYAFNKEVEAGSYQLSNIIKRPNGLDEYKLEYREGTKILHCKIYRGMLSMEADFLTGATSKIKRYKSPIYYKPQFENFGRDLSVTDSLTIIGYGFKDSKINEIVRQKLNVAAQCKVIDPFLSAGAEDVAKKILPIIQIKHEKINEVIWNNDSNCSANS